MSDLWTQETPFTPRSTRLYQLIRSAGWTLKLYGISFGQVRVDAGLLDDAAAAAKSVVADVEDSHTFGIGFVIAHQGQHADWVLVHWWQSGGILAHRILTRPVGSAEPLRLAEPQLVACVWEFSVITFECDAWVDHVLTDPSRPDVDGYLRCGLTISADSAG